MKRLLATLALCLIQTIRIAGAEAAHDDHVISKLLSGDVFTFETERVQQLSALLQATGFNTVTLPIAWSVVEPEPGRFDFDPYLAALDRFTADGLRLILILDSSGRELIAQNQQSTRKVAVPLWLIERYPEATAQDFTGARGYNLDYADRSHLPALENFYRRAIEFLQARYGEHIVALAPGIMHELEIKYPQYGYRWQSYSEAAQQAFDAWLRMQDLPAGSLPVIDYGNRIAHHRPRVEPLFEPFMRFREALVRDYVCRLTGIIRDFDMIAVGYFGQNHSSHDAIYALGVIEQLTECFDKITVDYNFYDGWGIELNPDILPLLVNYARNLGHDRVMAGLYLERLHVDGRLPDAHLATVKETLRRLRDRPSAGIEIGNALFPVLARLAGLDLGPPISWSEQSSRWRVGLLASKWTFYQWIGERSFDRNLPQDALLASYRLLDDAPDIDVEVLGEQSLLDRDLSRYDALVLPLQTTLSVAMMDAIRDYHASGGRLVQDVQFNAFATDGSPLDGWASDLFGIGGISWHHEDERFIVDRRRLILPHQPRSHFTYTLLAPQPGHRLLMRRFGDPENGLMLRGERSLVFGFLPQLVADPGKGDYWRRLYVDAIRDLLSGSSAAEQALD